MRWAEWRLSARLAAQDHFIRWTTVITVVLLLGSSAFFLIKLLPEGWRSGVVVLHYNIYLGIDDVRGWKWLMVLPAAAMAVLLLDLLVAFGFFSRDPLASRTLVSVAFITTLLWAVGSFFLILVNT